MDANARVVHMYKILPMEAHPHLDMVMRLNLH